MPFFPFFSVEIPPPDKLSTEISRIFLYKITKILTKFCIYSNFIEVLQFLIAFLFQISKIIVNFFLPFLLFPLSRKTLSFLLCRISFSTFIQSYPVFSTFISAFPLYSSDFYPLSLYFFLSFLSLLLDRSFSCFFDPLSNFTKACSGWAKIHKKAHWKINPKGFSPS